jgi:hypothetical protein
VPDVIVTVGARSLDQPTADGRTSLLIVGADRREQTHESTLGAPVVSVHSGDDQARIGWDERLARLDSLVPPEATEV